MDSPPALSQSSMVYHAPHEPELEAGLQAVHTRGTLLPARSLKRMDVHDAV